MKILIFFHFLLISVSLVKADNELLSPDNPNAIVEVVGETDSFIFFVTYNGKPRDDNEVRKKVSIVMKDESGKRLTGVSIEYNAIDYRGPMLDGGTMEIKFGLNGQIEGIINIEKSIYEETREVRDGVTYFSKNRANESLIQKGDSKISYLGKDHSIINLSTSQASTGHFSQDLLARAKVGNTLPQFLLLKSIYSDEIQAKFAKSGYPSKNSMGCSIFTSFWKSIKKLF